MEIDEKLALDVLEIRDVCGFLKWRRAGRSYDLSGECVFILAEWVVLEYKRSSARKIRLWSFRSFSEAEEFRLKRREFYRMIGLETERGLSPASPKVSRSEMELFEAILGNPRLLRGIMHQFAIAEDE